MNEKRLPCCPWRIAPAAWREVCDVLEDPIRFLQEECPELIEEFEDRPAP